jgi:heme-degrading monooxygenase HmoA
MIARIWHGAVPAAKGEVYLERMRKVALPDYKSTAGNRGAFCLHRVEGDVAHFEMLTFWDDIDAIKRFAGDDYAVAKYYDFDRSFLIELEPFVRHYTVHDERGTASHLDHVLLDDGSVIHQALNGEL